MYPDNLSNGIQTREISEQFDSFVYVGGDVGTTRLSGS